MSISCRYLWPVHVYMLETLYILTDYVCLVISLESIPIFIWPLKLFLCTFTRPLMTLSIWYNLVISCSIFILPCSLSDLFIWLRHTRSEEKALAELRGNLVSQDIRWDQNWLEKMQSCLQGITLDTAYNGEVEVRESNQGWVGNTWSGSSLFLKQRRHLKHPLWVSEARHLLFWAFGL